MWLLGICLVGVDEGGVNKVMVTGGCGVIVKVMWKRCLRGLHLVHVFTLVLVV